MPWLAGMHCDLGGDERLAAWLADVAPWAAGPLPDEPAHILHWTRLDGAAPLGPAWTPLWRSGRVTGGLHEGRPMFVLDGEIGSDPIFPGSPQKIGSDPISPASPASAGGVWLASPDRARVWGTPDDGDEGWRALLTAVTFELFAWQGWLALHAGAVAIDRRGALIVGGSGAGKSTLVYLLARAGAGHVADDLVLVREREDGRWWASGTGAGVRLFPEDWWQDDEEERRPLDARGKTAPRAIGRPLADVPIDAVIALDSEHGSTSRWTSLAPGEAMKALVSQAALGLWPDAATAGLARLGELARLPAWSLSAGAEMLGSPTKAVELLRGLLDPSKVDQGSPPSPPVEQGSPPSPPVEQGFSPANPIAIVRFLSRGIYLALLLRAWPLERVLARVGRSDRLGLPARYAGDPDAAARLAAALFRRATLPFSSRCLVRSLFLFALLHPSQPDLRLIVGLRKTPAGAVEGHAWVTLDGRPLCPGDELAPEAFTALLTLPERP